MLSCVLRYVPRNTSPCRRSRTLEDVQKHHRALLQRRKMSPSGHIREDLYLFLSFRLLRRTSAVQQSYPPVRRSPAGSRQRPTLPPQTTILGPIFGTILGKIRGAIGPSTIRQRQTITAVRSVVAFRCWLLLRRKRRREPMGRRDFERVLRGRAVPAPIVFCPSYEWPIRRRHQVEGEGGGGGGQRSGHGGCWCVVLWFSKGASVPEREHLSAHASPGSTRCCTTIHGR